MQGRDIAVVVGVVATVALLLRLPGGGLPGLAMMGPGMMAGYRPGWGWAGGVEMMIFMALFWILLIGGLALLIGRATDTARVGQGRPRGEESAADILKRRYASGEITRAEFEQAKKDLS